jgi:multimeric flavodoxin WrbA
MKLAIFNGSPRMSKSNSTILIKKFIDGYNDYSTYTSDIHYLANISKIEENVIAFNESDSVIIIFPLYTDSMPGQVKFFFESIAHIDSKGKNVGFIVQSGFPESYQSTFVEKYLNKLAQRFEWNYLGTVIRGGVEGIQIMPSYMTKKLYKNFSDIGRYFARTGEFDSKIIAQLRKPYKLNAGNIFVMKIMSLIGLSNFYWDKNLKGNNAFEKRFDQPYFH